MFFLFKDHTDINTHVIYHDDGKWKYQVSASPETLITTLRPMGELIISSISRY